MSNHLAVASVTAVLAELLATSVDAAVTGARVLHHRPDAGDPATANVNIYAYGVRANAALGHMDLSTRRADGTTSQRPTLALDIQYLLTFYGDDSRLEPQRLLGAVATAIHARPILDPDFIQSALATVVDDAGDPYLEGSDLAFQIERIRLSPLPMDLESMSKLWSVFFQTAYSLSIAYQASVVLLEAEDVMPSSPLPVTRRSITAIPFARPRLLRVASSAGAQAPISGSSTVVLTGSGLAAENVRVRLNGELTDPESVTDREIRVILADAPADAQRAGPAIVQVVHLVSVEGTLRDWGFESGTATFLFRPEASVGTGSDAPTATRVRIDVEPDVQAGQRATLILNQGTDRFVFAAAPADTATSQVEFAIEDVPAGTWMWRIAIDGAESALTTDATGVPTGPTLDVP